MIVDTSAWMDFFAGRDTWQVAALVRELEDCLVATVCIREDRPLLHDDVDFGGLALVSPLRVLVRT